MECQMVLHTCRKSNISFPETRTTDLALSKDASHDAAVERC